jgi:hypothetical protein
VRAFRGRGSVHRGCERASFRESVHVHEGVLLKVTKSGFCITGCKSTCSGLESDRRGRESGKEGFCIVVDAVGLL